MVDEYRLISLHDGAERIMAIIELRPMYKEEMESYFEMNNFKLERVEKE